MLIRNLKEQILEILIDLGLVVTEDIEINVDYSQYLKVPPETIPEEPEQVLEE